MTVIEQTFGLKLGLEGFKGPLQDAGAGVFHLFDNHLEFAALDVETDAATYQYLTALFGLDADGAIAVAEHGAANLRSLILECEVPVPRGGLRKIGDLAFDPEQGKAELQTLFGLLNEAGHTVNQSIIMGIYHGLSVCDYEPLYNAPLTFCWRCL